MNLGAPELVIILVILLVLFGGRKLPGLARSMGESIREFRGAAKEALDGDDADQDSQA